MEKPMDFTKITPCGECCVGCKKKECGFCKGCIESGGNCKEWEESKECPIFKCANLHNVQFCGLCTEFPCEKLKKTITWNPTIINDLSKLADQYQKSIQNKM